MSSSKINFGLTPSLFEFSIINAFEPILLSIQIKFKLGLNFNASKPIDPQPAPISQMTPFLGSSRSAKICTRISLLVNKFGLSSKVLKTLSLIPNRGRLLFE